MAESVSVRLDVDSSGAVKSVQAAGREFREMGQDAERAGQEASSGAQQAGEAAERTGQQAAEAAQDMRQLSNAMESSSRRGVNFNEIIFATGDTVQDLQFGLRGAGNNIGFMAEQLASAGARAGSTTAVIKGLGAAIAGPAGIVLAIQALISLGPQIVDFFQKYVLGAEQASEASKELAQETRSTVQQLVSAIRDDEEGLTATLGLLETAQRELQQSFFRDQAISADEFRESIGAVNVLLEQLRGRSQEAEQQFIALTELGIPPEIADEIIRIANAADEAGDETKEMGEELEDVAELQAVRLSEQLKEAREQYERLQDTLAAGGGVRSVNQITQDVQLQGTGSLNLPGAEQFRQAGVDSINAGIASLQDMLDTVSTDSARQEILALIDRLEEAKAEIQGTKLEIEDMQQIVSGALSSGFQQLGAAIGQGESIMKSFAQAAASVLADIGTAVGKQLIAIGTARLAVGDPSGAALIAIGGGLIASSAALGSAFGGGGGSSASGTGSGGGRDRLQGGGVGAVNFGAASAAAGRGGQQQSVAVQQDTNVSLDVREPELFTLAAKLEETNRVRNRISKQ